MKNHLLKLVFPALMVLVAGCSSEENPPAASNSNAATTPPAQQVEAVSIGQPSPSAPPPGAIAPPGQAAPLGVPEVERPKNAQGESMSDLEFLNHLVAQLNEARVVPSEIQQKAFKTEAEQLAYEESQQKKQGPVRDINELVTAGVLKAVPQAPAGQKYAIDPATGKVVLQ